jgi:hypothetical protein
MWMKARTARQTAETETGAAGAGSGKVEVGWRWGGDVEYDDDDIADLSAWGGGVTLISDELIVIPDRRCESE